MEKIDTSTILWNAKQIQAATGISEAMAYQILHTKDAGAFCIGRRRYVHRDAFLQWLEKQATEGT